MGKGLAMIHSSVVMVPMTVIGWAVPKAYVLRYVPRIGRGGRWRGSRADAAKSRGREGEEARAGIWGRGGSQGDKVGLEWDRGCENRWGLVGGIEGSTGWESGRNLRSTRGAGAWNLHTGEERG